MFEEEMNEKAEYLQGVKKFNTHQMIIAKLIPSFNMPCHQYVSPSELNIHSVARRSQTAKQQRSGDGNQFSPSRFEDVIIIKFYISPPRHLVKPRASHVLIFRIVIKLLVSCYFHRVIIKSHHQTLQLLHQVVGQKANITGSISNTFSYYKFFQFNLDKLNPPVIKSCGFGNSLPKSYEDILQMKIPLHAHNTYCLIYFR